MRWVLILWPFALLLGGFACSAMDRLEESGRYAGGPGMFCMALGLAVLFVTGGIWSAWACWILFEM